MHGEDLWLFAHILHLLALHVAIYVFDLVEGVLNLTHTRLLLLNETFHELFAELKALDVV